MDASPYTLTVDQALRELDDTLGSGDDPVFYEGKETTPNRMAEHSWDRTPAESVNLTFWGMVGGRTRKIDGTLAAMVLDRRTRSGREPENRPSSQLLAAYEKTEFTVPRLGVLFRPNVHSLGLQHLMVAKGWQKAAFITAANPYSRPLSQESNAQRLESLEHLLHKEGFTTYAGMGVSFDGDWAEEGLFVPKIGHDQACKVGIRFEQNAIVAITSAFDAGVSRTSAFSAGMARLVALR